MTSLSSNKQKTLFFAIGNVLIAVLLNLIFVMTRIQQGMDEKIFYLEEIVLLTILICIPILLIKKILVSSQGREVEIKNYFIEKNQIYKKIPLQKFDHHLFVFLFLFLAVPLFKSIELDQLGVLAGTWLLTEKIFNLTEVMSVYQKKLPTLETRP